MEKLLLDIIAALRAMPDQTATLTPLELERIIHRHVRADQERTGARGLERRYSKRHLLPFYLRIRENSPSKWRSWNVDAALEERLVRCLRMKPRRTASGVATITVITRPHTCSSNCLYCPNDLRMPKSYLHNEPACQRAENNFFDPYLQVTSRLRALHQMGHATDKVELIVLGGTWSDYPRGYQIWFIRELFRALNDWPPNAAELRKRYQAYRLAGLSNHDEQLACFVAGEQRRVDALESTYNESFHRLYDASAPHQEVWSRMTATMEELRAEHKRNETAAHRVVGLVIETRPDTVTPESMRLCRELGCTKIQVGIQSTRQEVLDANRRATTIAQVKRAFSLIRLYGFKIHSHLMVNLVGSTPEADKHDFETFVNDPGFLPDEIKLYPCALVAGTDLNRAYAAGKWRPYSEQDLLDVLVADTLATPPYIRISRMIRDINATDILAGNKKANLRQMVEQRIQQAGEAGLVRDIRFREIARSQVDLATLALDDYSYETATTTEHFLQWVTPEVGAKRGADAKEAVEEHQPPMPPNRIVGFLRLSLPHWAAIQAGKTNVQADELPTKPSEAMIREVHVYGQAAHLGKVDASAQHQGLGRKLVARAEQIAREGGYDWLNVVSSVGTREYYRKLGFEDNGLYQRIRL